MSIIVLLLAVFFAMNMGGASFAASFATVDGSRILPQHTSALLFIAFVLLGALLFGQNVAVTLGENIVPAALMTPKAVMIIFLSAGLSMYAANVMGIPQSTSLVTVASIAGVGMHYHQVEMATIYYLIPFWIGLPVLSFVLTYVIAGCVYPPRKANFWLYERFANHQGKLKIFVIAAGCYNAFSVGTNNVANVAGPLMGFGDVALWALLFIFALVYGTGAFIFKAPLKTAGRKFVPLGLLTASIISLVSGTLMIAASSLGVPQSFVMLQLGAIFAVSGLKHGKRTTFSDPVTQKTLLTWTINPVITLFVSYGLSRVILN